MRGNLIHLVPKSMFTLLRIIQCCEMNIYLDRVSTRELRVKTIDMWSLGRKSQHL
jgi:hypothetical protein